VFVTPLAASDNFYPCADPKELSSVRAKYGIPTDAIYFLGLSTLEPRKNIDQLIRCFARLVSDQGLKDLRLVLVGAKGWDYNKIFEAISSLEISKDHIILTGYVAEEDLAALYSGALAFVYLSLYEGFGLPPLEAMQSGTPVITSNTSSLPEVVGNAGIMLDPLDADAICQSMLEVYRNGALRAEMTRKSLERAMLFSWTKCVRESVSAYRSALAE
jgi:glycosyltransferase involved in cell wall biosynthesis